MWQWLQPVIDSLFVGPLWPATVLLLLVISYLSLSLITSIDFDGPDMDLDANAWQSLGATTLRWLHLDTIPIIIWAGIFSSVNWLLAYILWNSFDSFRYEPTLMTSALLATRNGVIAGVITRFSTTPMLPYLAKGLAYDDESLVGQSAVVSSGEATPKFGQAKFDTGGAPLLLNIRTDGPHVIKGAKVQILAYEPKKRTYIVTPISTSENTVISSEN
ncbi:MAG TPA: hypothetical protein DDZ51_21505 [Planctomycetaceae bacterium]|nr:hypothetical protein [Planctomycetaceae bacterium]